MKTFHLLAPTSLCALLTILASCSGSHAASPTVPRSDEPTAVIAPELLEERCQPRPSFVHRLEGRLGSIEVSVGAQRYTRGGTTSYNLLLYTYDTFSNQHQRLEVTEEFWRGLPEFYESFAESEVDGSGLVSFAYSGWSSESVEFHRYMREGYWKLIAGQLTLHRIDMPKLVDTVELALADLDKLRKLPLTR